MNYKLFFIMIIILSIVVYGCGSYNNQAVKDQDHIIDQDADIVDPLKKQIAQMTIDEKIGQMVMVGLEGYENDQYSQEMIEKYKVGGFIFFERNIKDAYQTQIW